MKTIEERIQAGKYSSATKAAASIKMSKLPKGERNRLFAMIPEYYPENGSEIMAPVAKPVRLDPPARFAGKPELNQELDTIVIKILSYALRHQLSREQVFDILKERSSFEG